MALRSSLSLMEKDHPTLHASHLKAEILKCRHPDATGAYAFKWDYLADEILSKYCDDKTTPAEVRESAAIDKMLASETSCRDLNINGLKDFSSKQAVIYRASELISEIIGTTTSVYKSMDDHWGFSSGATSCRTRKFGDPFYKWHQTWALEVTADAFDIAKYMVRGTPLWECPEPNICDGNVVFTVPKNCDIDRAACKEPALNQALQACIGSYIRKRLRRVGVNLNDQSRNRDMARKGSITGRYCTIDLKSASDTISQRVVYELLSEDWVQLLDCLRSPSGYLPSGEVVTWEKHSTMGNGYTFELESLIFYCLVRAVMDIETLNRKDTYYARATQVSVYGDDIICPSHFYGPVVSCLEACGFTVNEKKSFHTGPFRESCGGHYYNGHDVKPFYIRKPLDTLARVIWFLNALRQWSSDSDGICDPSVFALWLKLRRKFCPPEFLGGRDMASISEVVSPESPRFSAYEVYPLRRINGVRALLRWFQFNTGTRHHDAVRFQYRRETYFDQTLDPTQTTMVVFDHIVDLRSELETRVKRYKPVLRNYGLFPQEQ